MLFWSKKGEKPLGSELIVPKANDGDSRSQTILNGKYSCNSPEITACINSCCISISAILSGRVNKGDFKIKHEFRVDKELLHCYIYIVPNNQNEAKIVYWRIKDIGDACIKIERLCVAPAIEGFGIGSAVLSCIHAIAKQWGMSGVLVNPGGYFSNCNEQIILEFMNETASKTETTEDTRERFYRKNGYVKYGENKYYLSL